MAAAVLDGAGPDDGSGIYDGEQEEEEEEEELDWTEEISFETLGWNNLAIQNAVEPLLLLMQHMLGVPLPDVPQRDLNTSERHGVLLSMRQYRPEHGVSRKFWAQNDARASSRSNG